MKRLFAAAIFVLGATSAFASVAEGDAHFARRAAGHQGSRAQSGEIDAAIAAYRSAVSSSPQDLEARWKLLRALRFKGAYAAASADAKKKIYSDARKEGEKAVAVVEQLVSSNGLSLRKSKESAIAKALEGKDGAAEVLYWDAALWGEWALVYGKMAAVREGVADRIRRNASIVRLADASVERGGGSRILGRLHNQTPRVPLITGWASDREAVRFLNEALAKDPQDKLTKTFLAEAMVAADSKTKTKAIVMLRDVVSSTADQTWIVEELSAQDDARQLLGAWGVK